MKRVLWNVALICAVMLASCGEGGGVASGDGPRATVRVLTASRNVAFGQPFVLDVVRRWQRGLQPSAFDERALAPLAVAALDVARREVDGFVEETRRFRAQAFVRGEVDVGPVRFVAASGASAAAEAMSEPLRIEVASALRSPDDLAIEQPMALAVPKEASGWVGAVIALLACAVATFVARTFWRPRSRLASAIEPSSPAQAPRDARADALRELQSLEGDSGDLGFDAAFAERLAETMRAWAAARIGRRTDVLTTDEIAAALWQRADATSQARFVAALSPCDLAKFAQTRADRAARMRAIADARACVEAQS